MFRSLRKAASSLEKSMETAFSSPPGTQTAFVGTILTISGIKLKLGHVFAEGGYSFIHNAKPLSSANTTTRYAVKRISCEDPDTRKQTNREIEFLRQLPRHPNIVRFYDAAFQDNHAFLLFELVDGGTLAERLNSSSLDTSRRLAIFADAVAAVIHLHAQTPPVAIRDVKLENLLYDRLERRYKLCDFGSVTTTTGRFTSRKEILAAEEEIASSCTAMYRAPEMVDLYSKQFICERVDVWALGCVWHAILFGTLPFDGQSSLQITKGLQHLPTHPTYPEDFISLLKGMLEVKPADRMDSFSVLEAVTRMLGKDVDPTLRNIGLNLRQRRMRDFGDCAAQPPSSSSSKLLIDETDFLSQHAQAPQPSTATINRPAPTPNLVEARTPSVGAIGASSQGSEGWADFDSAFGSSIPQSAKAQDSPAVDSRMSLKAPSQYTSNNSAQRSHAPDLLAPLVDFSDLHVSAPEAGRSSSAALTSTNMRQRNQESSQLKSGSRKANWEFEDLIDFG